MNFNIIEGQASRLSADDFEAFKWDYLNSEMTTHEVRLKYGLSKKEYSKITNEIRKELGIRCRPHTRAKNYYKNGNRWDIVRTNNYHTRHYGSLRCEHFSEKDMKKIIKKCRKMNWEYTSCTKYINGLRKRGRLL